MRTLKVNDFFCGCGGMGLAFKNAGFEIAGAWDFDKFAVQSYKHNVGDHVLQADIRELTYKDIPKTDVWAFGFPCQDLSFAGKRKGMILRCPKCGHELRIDIDAQSKEITFCPVCNGNFKSESRSGMFFEIMRLLKETQTHIPENMPEVIIAENVKGLKPYLKILQEQYAERGYKAHTQLLNSKWWKVAQNRERYVVVGTRNNRPFSFPIEQHETTPKLSSQIDNDVDEKYYIPDDKAQTIISQALTRFKNVGEIHACITPERIVKRQNGRRAKEPEEEMFTLTARDVHGVIVNENCEDIISHISKETGILNPNGTGKTLRAGGGAAV